MQATVYYFAKEFQWVTLKIENLSNEFHPIFFKCNIFLQGVPPCTEYNAFCKGVPLKNKKHKIHENEEGIKNYFFRSPEFII